MRVFLDSSILIEYIKGTQTKLLELLLGHDAEKYINHIIFSEFIFHFLSVMSGKSPLTLKNSQDIKKILEGHEPKELIDNFTILDMTEEIADESYSLMKKYNLLPNDSLILATCKFYEIPCLASYDSDFKDICQKEHITLIDSPKTFADAIASL